jgi:hypothetical protein
MKIAERKDGTRDWNILHLVSLTRRVLSLRDTTSSCARVFAQLLRQWLQGSGGDGEGALSGLVSDTMGGCGDCGVWFVLGKGR